jgi:hypothetical protein
VSEAAETKTYRLSRRLAERLGITVAVVEA